MVINLLLFSNCGRSSVERVLKFNEIKKALEKSRCWNMFTDLLRNLNIFKIDVAVRETVRRVYVSESSLMKMKSLIKKLADINGVEELKGIRFPNIFLLFTFSYQE